MTKKKILIVDDDPGILAMLQLMLRLEGFEVIVCDESPAVVDTIATQKPDLVLLDAMMPGLDGIQVLNAMRARELPNKPPVLLFTGNSNEAYLKMAMQSGASGLLAKPFVKEELLYQLQKFLNKS
ncbi:MAG: response regulator [Acidobacteria bacterium]|nr:response regulator [Acidobacteriota bacterium]MCI0724123.1 response regulator [Acidobacteriota bacterium]